MIDILMRAIIAFVTNEVNSDRINFRLERKITYDIQKWLDLGPTIFIRLITFIDKIY